MAEDTVSSENPIVISRADAKALGLKRYFLGADKPCKNGHVAERQVSNWNCIECSKILVKNYVSSVPEKAKKWRKDQYERNKEKDPSFFMKRYWANPEKHRAEMRERYQRDRENRIEKQQEYYRKNIEERKAYCRKRYHANRDVLIEQNKAWRAKNRDRFRENQRSYYRNNKHRFIIANGNRRARLRAAEGAFGKDDVKRIYDEQRGKCGVCKKTLRKKYHVDHIMPLALGGSNKPSNIQILCPTCNLQKGAKDPIDYMQSQGFLL